MSKETSIKELCDELNNSKELNGILTCKYHDKQMLLAGLMHLKKCQIAANYAITKIEEVLK